MSTLPPPRPTSTVVHDDYTPLLLCCLRAPGIDGLLNGPHLQEESDEKSTETEDWRVACFMGLLSVFASTHQVLRISPLPRARTHNAVCTSYNAVCTSYNAVCTLLQDGIYLLQCGMPHVHNLDVSIRYYSVNT